ncbi:MAG TPA: diacylglycerol kinase family protein [Gemmatimonadaceae bacterium]|jgi:diacylglycerol kinase family enzyme|nr:diacylglycerol kinase family protein [Gemmatimonadaceae bacterium]
MIPAFVNRGTGSAREASDVLRSAGAFDVSEVDPATLADAVRDAVSRGAARVAVAGGDGSIGSAAAVLAGTGVELAILPCGTLNHFAKDLALPISLPDAARVAARGRATLVDAATVNGRLFLNTSSVGAYVAFVRARERLEHRLGYSIASLVAGARLVVRMPTFRVAVHVEGTRRTYITPLVFVGIGERELKLPTLGARITGGQSGLHVMIIRRRSGARALALAFAAAARGTNVVAKTPALDSFLVDSCRVEPRTRVVSVDGELVRVTPPLEYRHMPGLLRVVTGAP